MSSAASVEGRERLRLFSALLLPDSTLTHLVQWQERELSGVGGVRVVPLENLHITLAFLGPRPVGEVEPILGELRAAAAAAHPIRLAARGYRETRSVGMLTLEDDEGRAAAMAVDLHGRLERLGVYEPERRQWRAHVTVLRFRKPPRLGPPLPDLGTIIPSEAALYHSLLRPSGAQYEILESVALGG